MENDIFKVSGVDIWTKARMRKANTYKYYLISNVYRPINFKINLSLGEKIKQMKWDIVSPIKTIFKSSIINMEAKKLK